MPIYDKSVRQLMHDMVTSFKLDSSKTFTRAQAKAWFKTNYSKVKEGTIDAHLLRLSTNAPSRTYYGPKPGEDDLFYQVDRYTFRLFNPNNDPKPIRTAADDTQLLPDPDDDADDKSAQFAYERDLKNFLAKNLDRLEHGLTLYEDDGVTGIEFPAGGRFIDILAVDAKSNLVVIELKVSRGYDRVAGQLLRYMAWIKKNQAEPNQDVRGVIVAREITDDLILACSSIPTIELYEYELSFNVNPIAGTT